MWPQTFAYQAEWWGKYEQPHHVYAPKCHFSDTEVHVYRVHSKLAELSITRHLTTGHHFRSAPSRI